MDNERITYRALLLHLHDHENEHAGRDWSASTVADLREEWRSCIQLDAYLCDHDEEPDYDGADAVMLSAESAVGDYPREAVAMMDRIIREVERDPLHRQFLDANYTAPEATAPDAISAAASQVARTVDAAAIVTYSKSGATALRAARERPDVPVVALIPNLAVARRLSLVWGLHCVRGEDARDFDEMVAHATRAVFFGGFGTAGQRVVITAGVPFGTPGATNLLHIAWLGDLQDHRKTPRDTTPPRAKSPD